MQRHVSNPSDTKSRIKAAAQLLFARNGVDGVTVQQIVSAAGQRNNAALHYHFGSKEELVRQLVVDGAKVLEARRQEMLRDLDARTATPTVRELLHVLVGPVIELGEDARFRGYVRFTSHLQASDRKAFQAALGGRWNASYAACVAKIKAMLPWPRELVDQRLSISSVYANAILSAREAALESRRSQTGRMWDRAYTASNIIDTLEWVLVGEPSAETRVLIASSGGAA